MMKTVRELIIDEDGTAAVEYALIAGVGTQHNWLRS